MEMTISINRFINFGKAIEFGKLELKNKNVLERNLKNSVKIPFRYRIIIFSVKLLLSIKSVRESYEIWYIDLLEKYLLYLRGYGETIKTLSLEILTNEYLIFESILPLYRNLDYLFQNLKPETKHEEKIYYLFHEVTEEIENIESTLDILIDPEMLQDIAQTKRILNDKEFSDLVKWDSALIK